MAAGCPAQVIAPSVERFDRLCQSDDLAARVVRGEQPQVPVRGEPDQRLRVPGARLVIGGCDRETGRAWLRRCNVVEPPGIEWAGTLARDAWLDRGAHARVFVNASRREDHGLAQLEALAAGVHIAAATAQESDHRDAEVFGDREAALVKEITKIHETVQRTTLSQAVEFYTVTPPKGEYVLIVAGAPEPEREELTLEQAVKLAESYVSGGSPASKAAKLAAAESGLPRAEIYKAITQK